MSYLLEKVDIREMEVCSTSGEVPKYMKDNKPRSICLYSMIENYES